MQNKNKLTENLREQIKAFRPETFGGDITRTLETKWGKPETYPKRGQHPRILFTADDLPAIRAGMKGGTVNTGVLVDFSRRVQAECTGILPPKTEHDFWPGCYNWDGEVLVNIQAKAFQYQLTGDAVYGYEAILAMLNFLKTLDIGYFTADQWRRYGYAMYVAACVYDWCYDLMDDDLRLTMTSGVEHNLCAGTSSIPEKATWEGRKMEMGFPPLMWHGYVTGHPSELQFLCFYLSYALAIYDEVPGWWDMMGGRLYEEYIPIRRRMHAAGMFPQGTAEYAQMRFLGDLYCAWLMRSAIGESPFCTADMVTVVRSIIGHEAGGEGFFFVTGDGTAARRAEIAFDALIASYLSGDSVLRSYVEENMKIMTHQTSLAWHTFLSAADLVICLSRPIRTTADWRRDMATVQYNDGYYQQVIARSGWDGEAAPVVLLRGAGRTSGGHDHASAGNFEIYYKGILTGDGGCYDSWGGEEHFHYHQATIAHNSLLIFNPAHKNDWDGWYSGGQIPTGASGFDPVADWLTTDTKSIRGHATGECAGYYDAQMRHPSFVYYACDMTPAYDADTVDYVGRSTLTAFTGDRAVPMLLFVFDRIDAKDGDFRKTFLLQCVKEPTGEGNTLTIDNGKGRLTCVSLLGTDVTSVYGGDSRYFLPDQGKLMHCKADFAESDKMWGRAELSPKRGQKSDILLHVLYVTDSETPEQIVPGLLQADGAVGAIAFGRAAYFCTDTTYRTEPLTLPSAGAGRVRYHVGGLAAGKWTVTSAGETVATVTVTEEGHVAAFATDSMADIVLSRSAD